MFRRIFKVLSLSLKQSNTLSISRLSYSSLRRLRTLGPRSRVLNRLETAQPTLAFKTAQKASGSNRILPDDSILDKVTHVENVTVQVPSDEAHQVVRSDSQGAFLLAQSALVVGRQIEMMNVFLGYEQANKYKIMDPLGNLRGYILEEEGLGKSIGRQLMRTHRKMKATVLNPEGQIMFKITRPYSLVNSKIFICDENDELVGEVQQRWHLMKRKYDLFTGKNQFASINTPFLGWDFDLQDENGVVLGNVSRNFVGFAREIFTDTGEYVLRMDAVEGNSRGMTLDERAVTLACAISIDFDYFSRHSSNSWGGFIPFPIFGMGGEKQEPNEEGVNQSVPSTDEIPMSSQLPSSEPVTKKLGDPWLTDEQAGVSNPDDSTFIDSISDFFGDSD